MRLNFCQRAILLGIGLLICSSLAGQVHYVPLNHSVYRFLDYLFATGAAIPSHQQKPYSRSEVLTWLELAAREKPSVKTEGIIERYLNEFRDKELHTFHYTNNGNELNGDAIFRGASQGRTNSRPFYRLDVGGNIRGYLGKSLSFQTDIVTTIFMGNLDLQTGYGIKAELAPVKHHEYEESSSTDLVQTQVITNFSWGYFSFGSDLFEWGPGRSGNLLLDIDQYALSNIHGVITLGRFRFSQLFGVLNKLYPYVDQGEKHHAADQRKLVAHRLDVFISRRFQFGVSEAVIYNRDLEFAYLNPLLPLTVSEVETGDKDNNLAAVDFTFYPSRKWRTYAEVFIDDIDFRQNMFTYWGNKWAALLGCQWSHPFAVEGALVTFEAVRVEPWVYTHRDSANIYEFYGQSIGYDLEPNSLHLIVSCDWFLRPNLWAKFTLQKTQHGPGDRIFGIPQDKSAPKEFLAGQVENRYKLSLALDYEFYQNMWLRLNLWHESVQDERLDDTMAFFGSNRDSYGVLIAVDLNY